MKFSLALATGVAVVALGGGGAGAAGTPQVLHLDLSETSTPAFDAGTGEPRPGDRVFLKDGLYAWKGAKRGARVGSVDSTLTFMSTFGARGATVEVSGQMFLHGGSLRVEGIGRVGPGPNRFTLPIVGGTGSYAGARGTVELRDLGSSGDKSVLDIHLLP